MYLFDLLDTLELDEEDDGEDLVVVEPLHRAQVDIQDTVLTLHIHHQKYVTLKNIVYPGYRADPAHTIRNMSHSKHIFYPGYSADPAHQHIRNMSHSKQA